jgi:hypothetical protein
MSITCKRPNKHSFPRLVRGALAALATLALSSDAWADAIARQVSGQVEIGRGTPPVWTPLAVGAHVAPDEKIRTGADGRVELAVDAGTLRVHENSLLSLPAATPDADRVVLESGRSLFDVIRREGHRFEVDTPTVVVSVKGTRFGVETGADSGVVAVYRGVVGVHATEATDVVETLVREGFLATGGGDFPLELDVAPPGVDPWTAWQDFHAGAGPRTTPPTREKEVDRARASVRRTVDIDVVKRASERKPDLAERLRESLREAKEASTRGGDGKDSTTASSTTDAPPTLPASPDLVGSTLDTVDNVRGTLLDTTHSEGELDRFLTSIDTTAMTGGQAFPNGQTTLSADTLNGLQVDQVLQLVDGLETLQSTFDASPTPGTPTTFATDLQNVLVNDGMAPVDAQRLIDRLIGPLGL